jgi:hypothetical protein
MTSILEKENRLLVIELCCSSVNIFLNSVSIRVEQRQSEREGYYSRANTCSSKQQPSGKTIRLNLDACSSLPNYSNFFT